MPSNTLLQIRMPQWLQLPENSLSRGAACVAASPVLGLELAAHQRIPSCRLPKRLHCADILIGLTTSTLQYGQPLLPTQQTISCVCGPAGLSRTTHQFLVVIQQARKQAFKEATIRAAFKKTGIWPFQPSIVLQVIQERQAVRTPSPPANAVFNSSPFATPITLRQMNKVADKLATIAGDIDHLQQFIKGSLATATELVQVKRDLQRTKMAEDIANRRRLQKNRPLQSGGVLTVAQARRMVKVREDDELAKARRVVQAAEQRAHNKIKRIYADAAKEARKWRLTGRLGPAEVVEEVGKIRLLCRGL